MSRVLEQGAPGQTWQSGGGHTVQTEYRFNTANEVVRWKMSGNNAVFNGHYRANELYVIQTTDENGVVSFESDVFT